MSISTLAVAKIQQIMRGLQLVALLQVKEHHQHHHLKEIFKPLIMIEELEQAKIASKQTQEQRHLANVLPQQAPLVLALSPSHLMNSNVSLQEQDVMTSTKLLNWSSGT